MRTTADNDGAATTIMLTLDTMPSTPSLGSSGTVTDMNDAQLALDMKTSASVVVDPATVDLVLEMTAAFDSDGFQTPSLISRSDVVAAVLRAHGDVALAVDDVMSVIAIKQLRIDEQNARAQQSAHHDAQLQWHELCAGLGVRECDAFMQALDDLPDDEKTALLSTDGGFFQQLLLELDSAEQLDNGYDDGDNDAHPLAMLQRLYPDYRMEVIESTFERFDGDVNATANALFNLQSIDSVQSFAAVVSAQTRTAAAAFELQTNGPKVASRGHFPELPAAPPKNQKSQRRQQRVSRPQQRRGVVVLNAWERQDSVVDGSAAFPHEATLSTALKIDRLQRLLPSIDRSVIQTTYVLHGGNSDVTEATLREIFALPVVLLDDSTVDDRDAVDCEVDAAAAAASARRCSDNVETPSYATSRARVDAAREALSDRYCAVLESFRRSHNALASDRVRELSRARREVRDSQRDAAHQFFLAHVPALRQGRPIDLHGLIVMEALQVANEAIAYCRTQRIRRCLLICGVGHHSHDGKARILTAVQLSLTRRQIAFKSHSGTLTIFPSRSSALQ